ncbi:TetR/AcrR family transcriptional regulator [Lichenifustis flavocetrariae]|uniref:TetR/AcrR family transcriptional regulator n=1 Tax=Lichenifustis flavocetrariae TaxID=2949735 RepID=A0AA41Z7P3_9HYPH|nr:helix-turn-helix domain-containing protein [Lichenifustis flavocetrariae]MCW6512008.1 TetR/AcrR family transcriptional regulator [Lichenifustis flavocetrariae]
MEHRSDLQEMPMRADARKNYEHLLAVARAVITEHGADASLRDIARKAEVGLATLYRHFPTRDALLEALLHATLAELTQKAGELESSSAPDEALVSWSREGVAFVKSFSGVVDLMAAAIADPESALHTSCVSLRSAGTRLLLRAQAEGMARADIDGTDLFALIGAVGWIGDQPSFARRAAHLFDIVASAILTNPSSNGIRER